tara:strand:+ start:3904 stop:5289 length:1386 start_codon:yes stop_codon:yes gene_type:complete
MEGNSMSDESNNMSDENNNNTQEGMSMSDNDAVEKFEKTLATSGLEAACDEWGQGYDDEMERKLQAHVEKSFEENERTLAERVAALDAKAGSPEEFNNSLPNGKLVQTLCMTSEAVHAVNKRTLENSMGVLKNTKAVNQTIKAVVKAQDNMSMLKDYVSAVETHLEDLIDGATTAFEERITEERGLAKEKLDDRLMEFESDLSDLHDAQERIQGFEDLLANLPVDLNEVGDALEDHDNRLTDATHAIEELTSALDDLSDAPTAWPTEEEKREIRIELRSDAKEDLTEWLDNNVWSDVDDRCEAVLNEMDLSERLDMYELGKLVVQAMDESSLSLMAEKLPDHLCMSDLATEVVYEMDMWDVTQQVMDNMDMHDLAENVIRELDMDQIREEVLEGVEVVERCVPHIEDRIHTLEEKVKAMSGEADTDTKVHTVDVDGLAFRVDKLERVFHSMRSLIIDSEEF